MPSEYMEPQKLKARQEVIASAIDALTANRSEATLCRRSYVREVREHLVSRGGTDAIAAKQLTDDTIDRWEAFYDSIAQTKDAKHLKVAYLCGPNPENDLRVFCAAGILPENIWAFESDAGIHSEAISSALSSEFPFIKIINSGIDIFLEVSPIRFDIIYLDFCGPLPSRGSDQKTLLAISRIIARHALNSPGALITNVSLPTEKGDRVGRSLFARLIACYLYPKQFLEGDGDTTPEGPIFEGHDFEQWLSIVDSDVERYYGQFITRLLMDHASYIVPYNRVCNKSKIYRNFFKPLSASQINSLLDSVFHFQSEEFDGGDIICDPDSYPVLWTFAALDKKTNCKDECYPQIVNNDEVFSSFAEKFLKQLRPDGDVSNLIRSTTAATFLTRAHFVGNQFLSNPLSKVIEGHYFQNYYQFCDLLLDHQIVEFLFRQVTVPYHVNVQATRRWKYQAKSTPMFMDMTILDECRYLYDWMPTTDMVSAGFSSIERQLAYRFAMDGVSKHRRWYNNEYFFGTAVVSQDTESFEAKILFPRINLDTVTE